MPGSQSIMNTTVNAAAASLLKVWCGQKETSNVLKVKKFTSPITDDKTEAKKTGKGKRKFCPDCFYIGKRSGAKMNFRTSI